MVELGIPFTFKTFKEIEELPDGRRKLKEFIGKSIFKLES